MHVVLINSGGKDCLAAALILRRQEHTLHSLFIDLGTPNSTSAGEAAAKIAAKHAADHHAMAVVGITRVRHEKSGITSVPHQSVLVNILGGVYAFGKGIGAIASGERRGPETAGAGLAPVRSFPERVAEAFAIGKFCPPPLVLAPVIDFNDERIFATVKDEPLWRETVTCNEWPPCGKCARCVTRAKWLALDLPAPVVVSLGGSAGGSGGAR